MAAFRLRGRSVAALGVVILALGPAACSTPQETAHATTPADLHSSTASSAASAAASDRAADTSAPNPATPPAGTGLGPSPSSQPVLTADAPIGGATAEPPATNTAARIDEHTVRTKAVELRIEGVERVAELGGRHARPGYEFVIVDTSWKNVIPLTPVNKKEQSSGPTAGFGGFGTSRPASRDPGDIEMKPTPYVVPMLAKQMWLFTDGRYADTVDLEALEAVPDHFSRDGFAIPRIDDVTRGKTVFEAPIDPKYQAFQFYDTDHGHALIPLVGTPVSPPPLGPARESALLRLEAGAAGNAPAGIRVPEGRRAVVVALRGTSRSARDIVDVPVFQFVYAQTERGCISRPERATDGLPRAFGDLASFPPTGANEGQLLFFVPAETKSVRLLLRPQRDTLDLPAPTDFQPAWPTPVRTITDGSTLRLHLLPTPSLPPGLPPPAPGRAYQLLDLTVENLKSQGIELQFVQVRLQAPDGSFIDPSPLSTAVPCALSSDGVIPPASARRFVLVYDVATDAPARRVNYRGFEVEETTVDLP